MTALTFAPKRIAQIERGEKTQTRRPVKPNDTLSRYNPPVPGRPKSWPGSPVPAVCMKPSDRVRWYEGCTRAIKPGRTAAGVGRVRITGICRECVRDISEADARAEGFASRQDFFDVWVDMYGEDALDNDCWVLEFEYLRESANE